jgi:ABC-type dipeptide/oligopeptide/nickel transport system ATPase component
MRELRGNRIAMIFQDPMMTLNPVLSIATQMVETILAHEKVPRGRRARPGPRSARQGRIPSPDERLEGVSASVLRRDAPARGDRDCAAQQSDLIIADEPTTGRLDVTIQGQILFEMQKLTRETGAALIWITHDLSVIAGLADRVCVHVRGAHRRAGNVVDVLTQPQHPYTQGCSIRYRLEAGAERGCARSRGWRRSALDRAAAARSARGARTRPSAVRGSAGHAAHGRERTGGPLPSTRSGLRAPGP